MTAHIVMETAFKPEGRLKRIIIGDARFLQQTGGTLPRRARTDEFKALTDDETAQIAHFFAETTI